MARPSIDKVTDNFSNAGKNNSTFDDFVIKDYLQVWKFPYDEETVIRFIPDGDETNPLAFLHERHTHQLDPRGQLYLSLKQHAGAANCPFAQFAGEFYVAAEQAEKEKNVPLELELKGKGKQYYRKKTYLAKALLISSTIEQLKDQVGKVVKVEVGPALFTVIQAAFKSGNFEDYPDSLENGCNFKIVKTKKGEYANYDSSCFIYRKTPLTGKNLETAKAAIEPLQNLVTDNAVLLSLEEAQALIDKQRSYNTPSITARVAAALHDEATAGDSEPAKPSAVLEQIKARQAERAKTEAKAEVPF